MGCMKCGRETDGYFCSECLEGMQKRPGRNPSVVSLLRRERAAYYSRKQYSHPENLETDAMLKRVRQSNRRLRFVAGLLALMLLLSGSMLLYLYRNWQDRPLGQNYSVTAPKETEAPITK